MHDSQLQQKMSSLHEYFNCSFFNDTVSLDGFGYILFRVEVKLLKVPINSNKMSILT
jgi:hypothetical protein